MQKTIASSTQAARKPAIKLATFALSALLGSALIPSAQAEGPSCAKLTKQRIAAFRASINAAGVGAIAKLNVANAEGNAVRAEIGVSSAGGWNYIQGLDLVLDAVDENAFNSPPCQSMFYPANVIPGAPAVPNNINACFRVQVAPLLEHELYWSTLHVYYNGAHRSRASAEAGFTAVRDLLRESRALSNDASRCMLEYAQSTLSPE
jgi:hypothetical protein